MSHRTAEMIDEFIDRQRRTEENKISSNEFIAVQSKGIKYMMLIAALISTSLSALIIFIHNQIDIGILFALLGVVSVLILPTLFSYKCYIDRVSMKEEYFILCFKVKKEVFWKDITHKLIMRNKGGNEITSISFYNSERKKLISFDNSIVGFGKIISMSKRIPKLR